MGIVSGGLVSNKGLTANPRCDGSLPKINGKADRDRWPCRGFFPNPRG
jgi:hypothetical protein